MNEEQKIASMLSLCMKAGKLGTGETMAEKMLRSGEAKLLIVAADASDNTREKFVNKCFYYQTPVRVFGDKAFLSRCVGRQNRAVFVVLEENFAARLEVLIQEVAECPKSAYTN